MFYDVWILSDSVGLNRDINDGKGALKSHGEGTMICWHCYIDQTWNRLLLDDSDGQSAEMKKTHS